MKKITWEYIVDAMNQMYNINTFTKKKFSIFEIISMIKKIYNEEK